MSNLSLIKETKEAVAHLKKFGYAVTENVIATEKCRLMAEAADNFEKKYTKEKKSSIHKLDSNEEQTLIRDAHIALPMLLPLIDNPTIWDVICEVLNDTPILDGFSISRTGSTDGLIHDDGHLPVRDFTHTTDIIAVVCLDDFTETNGGTFIWPLSHNSGIRPQNEFEPNFVPPGGLNVVAPRGSVVYMLGQTWHRIAKNSDGTRRWGALIHYKKWWIKPSTDYTQCGPELFSQLTLRQKVLFGFNSRPPLNVDKRVKTLINEDSLPDNYEKVLQL